MGAPGMKYILIGVIAIVLGYVFRDSINGFLDGLFWVVAAIGALLVLFGALKFFQAGKRGSMGGEDERVKLRNEVLLHTLARLTYADSNTKAIEVEAVRKIYRRETGLDVSAAEIRVTARGDLHESQDFGRYLSKAGSKMDIEDKCFILKAMAEIVKSDGNVSPGEVEFFDEVGKAFKMNPSEIAELRK